jgi:hypothetical protein
MIMTWTDHLGNKYNKVKDMTNTYSVPYQTFKNRLKAGWNLEQALTTPIPDKYKRLRKNASEDVSVAENISDASAVDHLGNRYNTVEEMCTHYDIPVSIFQIRIREKWNLERALTTPVPRAEVKYVDHLGNKFYSLPELCAYYHITPTTYKHREESGWSIEKILTTPVKTPRNKTSNLIDDENGNKFLSFDELSCYYDIPYFGPYNYWCQPIQEYVARCQEFCGAPIYYGPNRETYHNFSQMVEAYGKDVDLVRARLGRGWSLDEALSWPADECSDDLFKDHLGNTFPTKSAMCRFYEINIGTFNLRMRSGWSLEDALTKEVVHNSSVTDHLGNEFKTISEMCEHYNMTKSILNSRIGLGWSLERALTTPVVKYKKGE